MRQGLRGLRGASLVKKLQIETGDWGKVGIGRTCIFLFSCPLSMILLRGWAASLGIFPTQVSNRRLLHCRFLLPLSHLGSDQNWNPDFSYPNLLFSLSFTVTDPCIRSVDPTKTPLRLTPHREFISKYIHTYRFSPPLLPPAQSNHLLLGLL